MTAMAGAASFWLTVALAVAASVLSAFCISDPVSQPKHAPYAFLGQWFVWLITPLAWGTVAISLAFTWFKPFDLLAVAAAAVICRWGAQAVCSLEWRKRAPRRVSYASYLAHPQRSRRVIL
jgi:hypothetical protein